MKTLMAVMFEAALMLSSSARAADPDFWKMVGMRCETLPSRALATKLEMDAVLYPQLAEIAKEVREAASADFQICMNNALDAMDRETELLHKGMIK